MRKLQYACRPESLDPELRRVFFLTKKTEGTTSFLARKSRFSSIKFIIFIFLNIFGFEHYNAMGMLGYETFLFDERFVKNEILKRKKRKNLLDIGAGNGSITKSFETHIKDITCIEPSLSFQKILKKRGYKIQEKNSGELYDIVTIFNVLDICENPEDVLSEAKKSLSPKGILIITLPFPVRTTSWDIKDIKKSNHLGQTKDTSFEIGASQFHEQFLLKNNLSVVGFTRLPYLVSLPESRSVTVYDNGFFICEKGN